MVDRLIESNLLKKQVFQLPEPDAEAQRHSERLIAIIADAIEKNGGRIPFERYMALALTAPGLGYYVSGNQKFGAAGDFVTAPEISPLFSRCIARQCAEVLTQLDSGRKVILEFGAGSGVMAAEILHELQSCFKLPEEYLILEISPELRQRQQQLIANKVPDLLPMVRWIDRLPSRPVDGVILANEVLDAMPVHRFYKNGDNIGEVYVQWDQERLSWCEGPFSSDLLRNQVEALTTDLPDKYISEINLAAQAWVSTVAPVLGNGIICIFDYGFSQQEYFHPAREQGTLMCHYRHHSHGDPFVYPGLQDITAHVNFSAITNSAYEAGLDIKGFCTQAMFLLACGATDMLNEYDSDTIDYLKLAQQLKTLTMPGEMGDLFKVLVLGRSIDSELLGFRHQNLLYKL